MSTGVFWTHFWSWWAKIPPALMKDPDSVESAYLLTCIHLPKDRAPPAFSIHCVQPSGIAWSLICSHRCHSAPGTPDLFKAASPLVWHQKHLWPHFQGSSLEQCCSLKSHSSLNLIGQREVSQWWGKTYTVNSEGTSRTDVAVNTSLVEENKNTRTVTPVLPYLTTE